MKYQEKGIASKEDIIDVLKGTFVKAARGQLMVDGQQVEMPEDKEMEYKVKYENDEYEGSLSVKVSWVNAEEEEEEDEEKEE